MPAIKAILFDLDDTLIDDTTSYALSMSRLCDDFGLDLAALRPAYDALSPPYWGSGDLAAQRKALWRQALRDAGYDPSLAAAVRDAYLRHRVETSAPLAGVEAVLIELSASYRLGVITNGGGDIQARRLAHSGLDRYLELLVTSSDVDAGKPDARIFDYALQRLGVAADEAWMVGDSLDSDVAGALNAGMTGVWLNRNDEADAPPRADHVVASLRALAGLLA